MPRAGLAKRLFSNVGYKFTALALATLVWYIVQGEEVLEVNAKLDVKIEVTPDFVVRDAGIISRDITLRGPRVLVGNLQGKAMQALIRVPPGKMGSLRYRLDKEFIPRWDNRVRLTIHDPYITMMVEERMTKKLAVKPIILGDVGKDLMIDEIVATPQEIEIKGAKSDVSRVTEISTEPIDVTGLLESKVISTNISRAALPDLELSASAINVNLIVGPKKATKNISVVPIEIVGSDKVGSARPAGVSIIVSAAEAVVGHINQKDIRATVSAKDLAPGRYDLSVLVSVPEGVIVKDVSPKVISVEIYNQKKLRP
jgi:hypothetical protein